MRDVVEELKDVAARAVELARKAGAEAAEALARDGAELEVKVRLGETELVKEAGSRALGLRVFVDRRAAVTYTSDFAPAALEAFVRDTVALARLAEPDELNTLPADDELARELPDLALYDEETHRLDAGWALERARRGEDAARKADPRVTNSEGATFSRSNGAVAFATSGGFVGGYRGTYHSFYVEPICDDEDGKKRNGYWWTASRFVADLADPEAVGLEAARRTVAKLGARKVDTCEAPVVFDPEAGRGLLRELYSVANGAAFYRKSSYLVGREGSPVASPLVTIVDDPLIPRGPGSRPFDGDGLSSRRNVVVRDGVLETVLCDTYSARRLGRRSTGSAGRGVGGTPGPSPSNFVLQAGTTPAAEIVKGIDRGLYVTDMMGFGFNPVTGDFSRGAGGFWIEKGELAFPVTEVTISAAFDDLWKGIDAVGDDLELRSALACPTFRVGRMTIAGR
jgi:PmbA protein